MSKKTTVSLQFSSNKIRGPQRESPLVIVLHTICPADNATAGSLGRRRAGQLRFGFVAVSAGHIVYTVKKSSFHKKY
jgi:hypothetical protein